MSSSAPFPLPAIDEEDETDLLPALNLSEISHQLDFTAHQEQAYFGKGYDDSVLQSYRICQNHQHHHQHHQHQQHQHLLQQQQQQQQWFSGNYQQVHPHELQQSGASPYSASSYDYPAQSYDFAAASSAGYPILHCGVQQQQQPLASQHSQQQQPLASQHSQMEQYNSFAASGYGYAHHPASTLGHSQAAVAGYCL
jgi:hypothetical protein